MSYITTGWPELDKLIAGTSGPDYEGIIPSGITVVTYEDDKAKEVFTQTFREAHSEILPLGINMAGRPFKILVDPNLEHIDILAVVARVTEDFDCLLVVGPHMSLSQHWKYYANLLVTLRYQGGSVWAKVEKSRETDAGCSPLDDYQMVFKKE